MTPACPPLPADGFGSVLTALRSVDCQSGQAVAVAFDRLFGQHGALGQALTILLTIYVALFALNLLAGRGRLTMDMLTPRMLQLGLALTFATSWVAYQSVAWNLLVEAPDQVASLLLGTKGSATQLFALRLDGLFDVLARSAQMAQGANAMAPAPGSPVPQFAGTPARPADLLWLASLLLLLGTVGVLVVARIALAAVMALGPLFIVLALFRGTRGLFEGWLKAALMLAITPILAVLLGGATMVMINPMIGALVQAGGQVPIGLAASIFLAAFVYVALMVLATRAARLIAGSWHLGGRDPAGAVAVPLASPLAAPGAGPAPLAGDPALGDERLRGTIVAAGARDQDLAIRLDGSAVRAWSPRSGQGGSGAGPESEAGPLPSRLDPRIRPATQISRARAKAPA
ncbi:type IV secretion system protein [Novosphingobium aerophilum]|uniref:Type IV secretion system protein n=1 Tax=Novosphingobium aerophilum TaxID=2839843 RepID=A0A7X1F4L7_9SPHN|nr:type IV secretion system protein [Novosphingobium aerophilum]MBC2650307.1 type IV secretion system protein [Novosphingobium aerophilum]